VAKLFQGTSSKVRLIQLAKPTNLASGGLNVHSTCSLSWICVLSLMFQ